MAGAGLETSVLSEVVLPAALAVMTFGMGMGLTPADFRRVREQPHAVATGVAAQILALPLLAMVTATVFYVLFGLSSTLVLGLLLLACCPGGATSNLLTHLARGDSALSVTLTTISSLASVVTTPLVFYGATAVLLGDPSKVSVSFTGMAALVLLMVVIPILLGMQIRRWRPRWADLADRPVRVASIVLFVAVVAGVIAQNREQFWTLAALSIPAALTLNVLALGAGMFAARAARLGERETRAIAIEVGFQNGTLGMALAITQLNSPQAAIVPGFYGLVMFLTGGLLAWRWAKGTPPRRAIATEGATAER